MRSEGKNTEALFEAAIKSLGKRAYLYRLVDAAEVRGRTGKVGFARAQPSDYILVKDGVTSFVEVKSCENKTSFPFSYLKTNQKGSARMITAAGGSYWIFLLKLDSGTWYKLPSILIERTISEGHQSLKWMDIAQFQLKDFNNA